MNNQNGPRAADSEPAELETVTRTRDTGERPSLSVIETVAEAVETDPELLRPLYDVIDPDALDAMFGSDADRNRERSSANASVSFRFEGCAVTVHADGRTIASRV
jgi:hypothetical protein